MNIHLVSHSVIFIEDLVCARHGVACCDIKISRSGSITCGASAKGKGRDPGSNIMKNFKMVTAER